jgi:hypothetical protein
MHPNTICELATLRHHDLQVRAAQERLAAEATASRHRQSGRMTAPRMRIRVRLGSLLIAVGARLRGMTDVQSSADSLRGAQHAGLS